MWGGARDAWGGLADQSARRGAIQVLPQSSKALKQDESALATEVLVVARADKLERASAYEFLKALDRTLTAGAGRGCVKRDRAGSEPREKEACERRHGAR